MNFISAEALPAWTEKDRETMKSKKAGRTPASSDKKYADKTTQLQTHATFHEEEKWPPEDKVKICRALFPVL